MRWSRVFTLAIAACSIACSEALLGPRMARDRAALFDDLWEGFDLHYSFFELKRVNWDSLGAHYRPLALAARTDQEFAETLAAMLAELRDVHVSITPRGSESTRRFVSTHETTPTYFDVNRVLTRYVTSPRSTSGAHIKFGMVAPTVGYLYLATFEGSSWDDEMDEALAALSSATSLIVDVRNNPGGKYNIATAIAGRFADRVRTFAYVRRRNGPAHSDFTEPLERSFGPAGTAQFSGRVFVLANRASFSSAEDFVLAMRSVPTVTVVGDTTAGASGGPIIRELANGWTYRLSEWIAYMPDGRTFEGIGLAPDVVIKATASDAISSIDAALEKARALAVGR